MEEDSDSSGTTDEMEEIYEFLQKQGVSHSQICDMKFNELTVKLLREMNDDVMKGFLPKYSQRVALRDYLNLKSGTRRKRKLVHELKLRMKRQDGNGKSKKRRADRQILLGWVMCWDGEKYSQVREPLGGGTRNIYVPITATKEFILRKAINYFFPNGKSNKLKIEDYEVDLFNSQHKPIEENATVESILHVTAFQKLRFYLATKEKSTVTSPSAASVCNNDEVDISSDDSDELVSYKRIKKSEEPKQSRITSTITSADVGENGNMKGEDNSTLEERYIDNSSHSQVSEFTILVNSILDAEGNNMSLILPSTSNNTEFPTEIFDGLNNRTLEVELNTQKFEDEINPHQIFENEVNPFQKFEDETNPQQIFNNEPSPYQEFEDILSYLNKSINKEKSNVFNVFRDEIFTCCVRAMRRQSFCPTDKIFVKFSDIEGSSEGAIDDGGPTRELFRLVLNFIKDSHMFVGNHKKHISLDGKALENKYYYEAGRLIALSLVHGGPAPHFFSNILFNLLIGNEQVLPTFEDVDEEIRSFLSRLENTDTLSDAQNLITETNVFSIAGFNYIFNLDEKKDIIQGTLKFYAIIRIKEALAQFVQGLETCDVYNNLLKYPNLFRKHFCDDIKMLSAEDFEKFFEINYSRIGCEDNQCLKRAQSTDQEEIISLSDILIFATGADQIPPLGLPMKPQITFLHGDASIYPKANTCSLELKLPVEHGSYEEFTNAMNFGIANCNSFGFA